MQNSFSAPDARGAANIVFLCWARVFGLPLLSVPRGVFFQKKNWLSDDQLTTPCVLLFLFTVDTSRCIGNRICRITKQISIGATHAC